MSTVGQGHGKKRLKILQKGRLEKLEKDLMNLLKNLMFIGPCIILIVE